MDYKLVAQRFKALRKAKELSQQEMADRLDISQTHISGIEGGRYRPSRPLIRVASTEFE